METTQTTDPLKVGALGDLWAELEATRRVIACLADEHLAWRPHPKSMSLGELATHLANLLIWQRSILATDGLDVATLPPSLVPDESVERLLERFDRNRAELDAAVTEATEERLLQTWSIHHGEHVIASEPRWLMMRRMGISHMVHHRAQLTVYLRMLDQPVPGLYGPSADER